MEQFEQIRRDYAREELSIRALAKRHGVHRRAVRQALTGRCSMEQMAVLAGLAGLAGSRCSPTAWCWRAIWSTNRPTSFIRSNSPAARRR